MKKINLLCVYILKKFKFYKTDRNLEHFLELVAENYLNVDKLYKIQHVWYSYLGPTNISLRVVLPSYSTYCIARQSIA